MHLHCTAYLPALPFQTECGIVQFLSSWTDGVGDRTMFFSSGLTLLKYENVYLHVYETAPPTRAVIGRVRFMADSDLIATFGGHPQICALSMTG